MNKDTLNIEVTKRADGSFWAHCNELPHLSSRGKTQANALEKLANVIDFEIEVNGDLSYGWQPMETAPKEQWILVQDEDRDVHKSMWYYTNVYRSNEQDWIISYSYRDDSGEYYTVENPIGWKHLPT